MERKVLKERNRIQKAITFEIKAIDLMIIAFGEVLNTCGIQHQAFHSRSWFGRTSAIRIPKADSIEKMPMIKLVLSSMGLVFSLYKVGLICLI